MIQVYCYRAFPATVSLDHIEPYPARNRIVGIGLAASKRINIQSLNTLIAVILSNSSPLTLLSSVKNPSACFCSRIISLDDSFLIKGNLIA